MRIAIIALLLTGIIGCTKYPVEPTINCPAFVRAMANKDIIAVSAAIDELTIDLVATPTSTDSNGHLKNITTLVNRLNNSCSLSAKGVCYECIKTLPAQTEIEVAITNTEPIQYRSFTLVTDDSGKLKVTDVF